MHNIGQLRGRERGQEVKRSRERETETETERERNRDRWMGRRVYLINCHRFASIRNQISVHFLKETWNGSSQSFDPFPKSLISLAAIISFFAS
jgi:hypothetical protein